MAIMPGPVDDLRIDRTTRKRIEKTAKKKNPANTAVASVGSFMIKGLCAETPRPIAS